MKQWHVELTDESTRLVEADSVEIRDGAFWFLRKMNEGRHGLTQELWAVVPTARVVIIEELVL